MEPREENQRVEVASDGAINESQSLLAAVGVKAPPLRSEAHLEAFAKDSQEYLETFLQLADQKAAFVSAGAGALLAVLYGAGAHGSFLKPVATYDLTACIAILAMTALTLAAGFAVSVVFPRESAGGSGLFYWARIQEFDSGADYAKTILSLSPEQANRERLRNCHDLADVCARKYNSLRWAFATGVLGTVATLAYFLTSTS